MIVRELVTKLGFEVDYGNIVKFERSVDKFKKKVEGLSSALAVAKKAVIGIVAASTGLSALSISTAKAAKSAEMLAQSLGMTTKDLQELELVAESSIDNFNGLEQSFNKFDKALNISSSSSNLAKQEIASLGISITGLDGKLKKSKDLYFEVAGAISKIDDPNRQLNLSRKLFGQSDTELVKILSEGNEAFAKRRDEVIKLGYIIDSKGVKSANELTKSWRNFAIIVDGVKKELSVKFMPVFNELLTNFQKWFVANRDIISQGLTVFVKILSNSLSILGKIVGVILIPIKALINLFGGLENTIRVLATALIVVLAPSIYSAVKAFGVLTGVLLANPITWWISLISAAAIAIGLLVDDLYNFSIGAESVTADVLKYFFDFEGDFKDIINNISDFFIDKFTAIKDFFESVISSLSFGLSSIVNKTNKAKDDINNEKKQERVVTTYVDKDTGLNVTVVTPKEKVTTSNQFSKSNKRNRLVEPVQDVIDEPFNRMEEIIAPKINFVRGSRLALSDDPVGIRTKLETDMANLSQNKTPQTIILEPDFDKLNSMGNASRGRVTNKVTQNITETITVVVPEGTTQQQASSITEQVSNTIQQQFDSNILRGMDSIFEG